MSISQNNSDYSGDFKDWGEAIDDKGTWKTLSGGGNGEWKYLFDHHVNIWGTCNSVPGQFIAPDNFVGGTAALSAIVSDWKAAQDAGIVFLPAAGYRGGYAVHDVFVGGRYWSSAASDEDDACGVSFDGKVDPDYNDYRCRGFSVRLITESY